MFKKVREQLGTKAAAIGLATILFGGGVAMALPDEAIIGQESAAANQAAAEETAAAAQEAAAANQTAAKETGAAAQETAAANQAAAEEVASIAQENGDDNGPPEVVETFLADLRDWVGCIQDGARDHAQAVQEGARAHAELQSNADTRMEDDEFVGGEYDDDAKLACGVKPVNPNDANGDDGVGAQGGPGDDGDGGRPADVGKPADAGPDN